MNDNASLIRADAIAIPLRDWSVDLIVTSPPYFALRSYQDGGEHYDGQIGSEASPAAFLAALWAVTDECWRVLKPSGSLWVNLGDKYAGAGAGVRPKSKMLLPHRYALGCVDPEYRGHVEGVGRQTGPQWICRSDVVWSKPNGLPESVTDRVRSSHEYLFHLTKSERYYAGIDAIREAYEAPNATRSGGKRLAAGTHGRESSSTLALPSSESMNPLGKVPGSVWTIPTESLIVPDWLGVDHYAAFPTELPRRIILGWTPTGICTACGDARAAVTEHLGYVQGGGRNYGTDPQTSRHGTGKATLGMTGTRTITGYRCACPDTHAPTRPAIVLDPFSGTGTTPMIARALGRYGIGIDLSNDYLRLARWRVFHSGHWDKACERTTGRPSQTPEHHPDQYDLFGGTL